MLIRYAQLNDKTEWFRLDRHLPEAAMLFIDSDHRRKGYEQPMEMIMIKAV